MRRSRTLVLAVSLAVIPAGCQPDPTQSSAFVSEAEAVAAAERLIDRFLPAIDELRSVGGNDPAVFNGLLSERQMAIEVESIEEKGERESFQVGKVEYFGFEAVQIVFAEEYPTTFVRVRLCFDNRGTRWVNSAGDDVTVVDREAWQPLELALIEDPDDPDRLVLDELNWWSGYDFCPTPRERAPAERPSD